MAKENVESSQKKYDIAPGKDISVLGTKIRVERILGGDGSVADSYLGKVGKKAVVVRKVCNDIGRFPLEGDRIKIITGFKEESTLLKKLNEAEGLKFDNTTSLKDRLTRVEATASKRNIVALVYFDDEIQIEEYAPEKYSVDKDPEIKHVVYSRLLQAASASYREGYSLHDFEPSKKDDRIRVKRIGSEINFKLIDFNGSAILTEYAEAKHDIGLLIGHYLQIFGDLGYSDKACLNDREGFEKQISRLSDSEKNFALALFYLHAGLNGEGNSDSETVKKIIPLLARFMAAQDSNNVLEMVSIYKSRELADSGLGLFLAKSAFSQNPESKIIQADVNRMPTSEENLYKIYSHKVETIGTALATGNSKKTLQKLNDEFISTFPDESHRELLTIVRNVIASNPTSKKHTDLALKILYIGNAKPADITELKESITELGINIPELDRVMGVFHKEITPTPIVTHKGATVSLTAKTELNIPREKQVEYRANHLARLNKNRTILMEEEASVDRLKLELALSQAREVNLVEDNQDLQDINEQQLYIMARMTREAEKLAKELEAAKSQLETQSQRIKYLEAEGQQRDFEYIELNDQLLNLKGE